MHEPIKSDCGNRQQGENNASHYASSSQWISEIYFDCLVYDFELYGELNLETVEGQ